MKAMRQRTAGLALVTALATGLLILGAPSPMQAATSGSDGFNDQYIFVATRSVNDMEGVHPAWKVPLFPITVLLDVAALPFAVIAGFVN